MVRTKKTDSSLASGVKEMDVNRSSQFHNFLIPRTLFKPALPTPQQIGLDKEDDQLIDATWLDSKVLASFYEAQAAEAATTQEVGRSVNNVGGSGKFFGHPMSRFYNCNFTDLLALQHSKVDVSPLAEATGWVPGREDYLVGSSASVSSCHFSYSQSESTSASMTVGYDITHGSDPTSDLAVNDNCTRKHQISQIHPYDLNIPLETVEDAISSKSIPEFAPMTPGKFKCEQSKQVSEVQISYLHERTNPESNKQDQQDTTVGTDCNSLQQDSSFTVTGYDENHNLSKIMGDGTDLNNTTPKARRKKHRPKVITENKTKRTPKPETPKPKRAYVRRKGNDKLTSATTETTGESTDKETPEHTKRSCRRSLNFDMEERPRDEGSTCKSTLDIYSEGQMQNICIAGVSSEPTVSHMQGTEFTVENRGSGVAHDFTSYTNQISIDYTPMPQTQASATTPSYNSRSEGNCQITGVSTPVSITQAIGVQSAPLICRTTTVLKNQEQAGILGRNCSSVTEQANASNRSPMGDQCYSLPTHDMTPWDHFPNIYRKKRTYTTTSQSSSVTAAKVVGPQTSCPKNNDKLEVTPAFRQLRKLTRKRSRCHTRVANLATIKRIAAQMAVGRDMQQVENSHKIHTCFEALVSEMSGTLARRKRTKKRNTLGNSASSSTNFMHENWRLFLSSFQHQFYPTAPGTVVSIDMLAEQLRCLDIHGEENALISYNFRNKEHGSLVLYRGEGSIVPFEGFIKKRRPRPKVHLDDETTRVWKLLLGNINSEGIDGTDEEKKKWWEEERSVFRGRADSFISRMHLIQGDRRFSKWKGSVVDSVIGVFLTQNVSDHLSSSAFMSLAARFPLEPNINHYPDNEERVNLLPNINHYPDNEEGVNLLLEEPEGWIMDLEESVKWNENISILPDCDQSSVMSHEKEYHEEKGAAYNNKSRFSNDGVSSRNEPEHKLLSPSESGSEIYQDSCQASVNCSIAQTAERVGSCSENNSETEDLTNGPKDNSLESSISSAKNLEVVRSSIPREIGTCRSVDMLPDDNTVDACDKQGENMTNLDDRERFMSESTITASRCILHLTPNSGELEAECFEICRGQFENATSEQSILTSESKSQVTENKQTMRIEEGSYSEKIKPSNSLQGENILQSHSGEAADPKVVADALVQGQNSEMRDVPNLPILSGETVYFTETTSISNDKHNANGSLSSKELNKAYIKALKAKSRRVGKEIKNESNWDILREQAEANENKRERTVETRDSLDWEAVRCADVDQIANTIKERGMNNMLAERIKDFLNRLVREHKSIDLEWLRDVPPDKAKEYLLSIRGLGLKSVECVRLLTLHHLAFPVDTNVGRIAVRLGWVPLQPLPESLQLHLLELYPVLESIQKYLWPRLCKLDQRTLYELHYQMITFGKVFCTKNRPNCNACPMRGECRHFASAFASARLALPGPEERSIVCDIEDMASNPHPFVQSISLPLLPPTTTQASGQPQENQQFGVLAKSTSEPHVSGPIIEEPATPEPEHVEVTETGTEDTFYEDPDEIPTIRLNIDEFTHNLQKYIQRNMELQEADVSKALVAITPEVASIPMPKLKNIKRLRTEHLVYELPDSHPLLIGLDRREPDDPCSYLLAIWGQGETADINETPKAQSSSSCEDSKTVRGTLLVPCRTAMYGSFPLNGTYFQVNEVFADHESSLNPINVPREWIWNLARRTVYFGTSIPSIFKGMPTGDIQKCFWRGYVCVRGFDQRTRAPRPLMTRLHLAPSKAKTKGTPNVN